MSIEFWLGNKDLLNIPADAVQYVYKIKEAMKKDSVTEIWTLIENYRIFELNFRHTSLLVDSELLGDVEKKLDMGEFPSKHEVLGIALEINLALNSDKKLL